MDGELLTRKELAQKLKVSVITINRWEKSGLPVIKVNGNRPRYDYQKVLDWMNKGIAKKH